MTLTLASVEVTPPKYNQLLVTQFYTLSEKNLNAIDASVLSNIAKKVSYDFMVTLNLARDAELAVNF